MVQNRAKHLIYALHANVNKNCIRKNYSFRLIYTVVYNPYVLNDSHTNIHIKDNSMRNSLQVITISAIINRQSYTLTIKNKTEKEQLPTKTNKTSSQVTTET